MYKGGGRERYDYGVGVTGCVGYLLKHSNLKAFVISSRSSSSLHATINMTYLFLRYTKTRMDFDILSDGRPTEDPDNGHSHMIASLAGDYVVNYIKMKENFENGKYDDNVVHFHNKLVAICRIKPDLPYGITVKSLRERGIKLFSFPL